MATGAVRHARLFASAHRVTPLEMHHTSTPPKKVGPVHFFARRFLGWRPERDSEQAAEHDQLTPRLHSLHLTGPSTPSTLPASSAPASPPGASVSPVGSPASYNSTPSPSHQSHKRAPPRIQHAHYHQVATSIPVHHHDALPPMPVPVPSASEILHRPRPHSIALERSRPLPNPWELSHLSPGPSLRPPIPSPLHTPTRRTEAITTDPKQRPGLRQCWGIKRDGTRCTRRIGGAAKKDSIGDSESERSDDDDTRREYCHQHIKEINKTDGFVVPRRRSHGKHVRSQSSPVLASNKEAYVDFHAYLSTVQDDEVCKAKLRAAMCRAPTEVDWEEHGYIYIYELRDRSTSDYIALKVGRAVNVYKRFEQWRSQCQSKSPLLRAYFPRPPGAAQDVLPGASEVLHKGSILSHKWEHLCHIELSAVGKRLNDKCTDCGSRHREIFLVPRHIGYPGVRSIVEKWLAFVQVVGAHEDGSVL